MKALHCSVLAMVVTIAGVSQTHLERLLIVAGGFYAKDDDPIDFGLIRWRKMIEAWPTLRVSEEK